MGEVGHKMGRGIIAHGLSFIFHSRNGLGILTVIVAAIVLPQNHVLFAAGVVVGTLSYLALEAYTHRRMHENPHSPFHQSHAAHHANPTPKNGVPELWVFAVYAAILLVAGYLQRPFLSGACLAGLCWLMAYEWIHYLCHCPYTPKTKLGWRIRVNHNKHHRLDDSKFYELLWVSKNKSRQSLNGEAPAAATTP